MVGFIGRILSHFGGSLSVSGAGSSDNATLALLGEAQRSYPSNLYPAGNGFDYALDVAVSIIEKLELPLTTALLSPLAEAIEAFAISNAIIPVEGDLVTSIRDGSESFEVREYLKAHIAFHKNRASNKRLFELAQLRFMQAFLAELPALSKSNNDTGTGFGVKLGDLLSDPGAAIDQVFEFAFAGELKNAGLFADLQYQIEVNTCNASGIDPDNPTTNLSKYVKPRDHQGSREELIDSYLAFTPFRKLLDTRLGFTIPKAVRFEHAHIVGGTGHGKTQLLSHLILQDMGEMLLGKKKSLVVIDSQGDLIRKLSSMAIFNPRNKQGLADKLVIIDPRDVGYPSALNIFAINKQRLEAYGPAERERCFNAAVELYEHFFKGLLGADLTAKQGVAFTYMARMMLELPNATIFTLRDMMDNPHAFKKDIEKLSGSVRMFYERELLSNSYNGTRKQISQRLWGVLAVPAFERMFGQEEHKIDLYELLNEGKIILINTSKALLKKEGSAIFGKFFVAAIAQAVTERAEIPEQIRTETIVYLDEAHEYADESLEELLNQGRKNKCGVVIAHQFLGQLSTKTKQTLLVNASIKMVGGLEYADHQAFAREMNTDVAFLKSLKKRKSGTEFGLSIKNVIPEALSLSVPFGLLEGSNWLDDVGRQALLEQNRARYCVKAAPMEAPTTEPIIETAPQQPADTLPEDIPNEGRGGYQHREIQRMIKNIGHDLGFGVAVEASCSNSDGAIDVLLTGEKTTIAIEVSVTTSADHEVENLKKCLAEPVDMVLCVSPDDAHRLDIQNLCIEKLGQSLLSRIVFLAPDSASEYLSQYDERETTLIRGYEVVTHIVKSDPRDVEYRKSRIKMVLERKLG